MKIITRLENVITTLPEHEIRYYFNSLKQIIADEMKKDKVNADLDQVLLATIHFADAFAQCHQENPQYEANHIKLKQAFRKLTHAAQCDGISVSIKQAVLNVGGIVCGTIAGVIGGIMGFASGIFKRKNIFTNISECMTTGIPMGCIMGATIGYRFPKKLFKNKYSRSLKFTLDQMQCNLHALSQSLKSFSDYAADIENELLSSMNSDKERNAFFNVKHEIEICSVEAQFFNKALKGVLTISPRNYENIIYIYSNQLGVFVFI